MTRRNAAPDPNKRPTAVLWYPKPEDAEVREWLVRYARRQRRTVTDQLGLLIADAMHADEATRAAVAPTELPRRLA